MSCPNRSCSSSTRPGSPASRLSNWASRPPNPSLSSPTRPSTGTARSPSGRNRWGSSMRWTPGRFSPLTPAATSSVTFRERYTNPRSLESLSWMASAVSRSTGASASASCLGSATSWGSAHTVDTLIVIARSRPLRSNIVPRSAGRTMSCTSWLSPRGGRAGGEEHDRGRLPHAEPALGCRHDPVGRLELGHLQAQPLVARLLRSGAGPELIEPELVLREHDVEGGDREQPGAGDEHREHRGQASAPAALGRRALPRAHQPQEVRPPPWLCRRRRGSS